MEMGEIKTRRIENQEPSLHDEVANHPGFVIEVEIHTCPISPSLALVAKFSPVCLLANTLL